MSYHDYNIIILKSPLMLWEGSFVAKKDDLYVGSSSVNQVRPEGYHGTRVYRGQARL